MPRNKTEAQAIDARKHVDETKSHAAQVSLAQVRFERWRENDMPAPVRMRYQSSGEMESDMRLLAESYLASFSGGENGDGWVDQPSCVGWWWFIGVLRRGLQQFKFHSPSVLSVYAGCQSTITTSSQGKEAIKVSAQSYLVKGPRGLAFDSGKATGLWRYIVQPLLPNAKDMMDCLTSHANNGDTSKVSAGRAK